MSQRTQENGGVAPLRRALFVRRLRARDDLVTNERARKKRQRFAAFIPKLEELKCVTAIALKGGDLLLDHRAIGEFEAYRPPIAAVVQMDHELESRVRSIRARRVVVFRKCHRGRFLRAQPLLIAGLMCQERWIALRF